MTAIDWDLFAARVPAGRVQVKWEFGRVGNWNYGILLDTKPFLDYERISINAPTDDAELYTHVRVQCLPGRSGQSVPLNKRPNDLKYLIDGTWLSFAQIMEG